MHPAAMAPPATIAGVTTTTVGKAGIDSFDEMLVGSPQSGRMRGMTGGRTPNRAPIG